MCLNRKPVRKQFPHDPLIEDICALPWAEGLKCLVFGGSQGAFDINDFFIQHQDDLTAKSIIILHIVGPNYYEKYGDPEKRWQEYNNKEKRITVVRVPYIQNMKQGYDWADIVIGRSGATSVTELLYFQKKALLIPFPHATDNHQWYNAKALENAGNGYILDQKELSLTSFLTIIEKINHITIKPKKYHEKLKEIIEK